MEAGAFANSLKDPEITSGGVDQSYENVLGRILLHAAVTVTKTLEASANKSLAGIHPALAIDRRQVNQVFKAKAVRLQFGHGKKATKGGRRG